MHLHFVQCGYYWTKRVSVFNLWAYIQRIPLYIFTCFVYAYLNISWICLIMFSVFFPIPSSHDFYPHILHYVRLHNAVISQGSLVSGRYLKQGITSSHIIRANSRYLTSVDIQIVLTWTFLFMYHVFIFIIAFLLYIANLILWNLCLVSFFCLSIFVSVFSL